MSVNAGDTSIERVLRGITIPSRPAVLLALQNELAKDDPDPMKMARTVSADVALSLAVLSLVNSAAFGLSRRVENIEQAAGVLGLNQLTTLVTSACVRNAVSFKGLKLERFWDASDKRARLMVRLSKGVKNINPSPAQSMGLFCDAGIPLLMQRFTDYMTTLDLANNSTNQTFTEIEFERHGIDHGRIGGMIAKSWGFDEILVQAIQLHHDYTLFGNRQVSESVTKLVAMSILCDRVIQEYSRMNVTQEWSKSADSIPGALMFSDHDIEDWTISLTEELARG
jgi:HD-like signal output (HDOD) protein